MLRVTGCVIKGRRGGPWAGAGRRTLLKEGVELGQEGKGRCGRQSRGEGPLSVRMAPAEDLERLLVSI